METQDRLQTRASSHIRTPVLPAVYNVNTRTPYPHIRRHRGWRLATIGRADCLLEHHCESDRSRRLSRVSSPTSNSSALWSSLSKGRNRAIGGVAGQVELSVGVRYLGRPLIERLFCRGGFGPALCRLQQEIA